MADDNTMSGGSQFGGRYNAPSTFLGSNTSSAPSRSSRGSAGSDGDGAGTGGGGTDGKGDAAQDTPGGEGDARSPDGGSEDSKGWSAGGSGGSSGGTSDGKHKSDYDWSKLKKASVTTLSDRWKGIVDVNDRVESIDWGKATDIVRKRSFVNDLGYATWSREQPSGSESGIEWGMYNEDSIRYAVLQMLSWYDPYKVGGRSVLKTNQGGLSNKEVDTNQDMMWPMLTSAVKSELETYFKNKWPNRHETNTVRWDTDWVRSGSVNVSYLGHLYQDPEAEHNYKNLEEGEAFQSRDVKTGMYVHWTGILPVAEPEYLSQLQGRKSSDNEILWDEWRSPSENHWVSGISDINQYYWGKEVKVFDNGASRLGRVNRREQFKTKQDNWVFFKYLDGPGRWHIPWDYERVREPAKATIRNEDGAEMTDFTGWWFWSEKGGGDGQNVGGCAWGNLFYGAQLDYINPGGTVQNPKVPWFKISKFLFMVEADAFNLRGYLSDGATSDTIKVSGKPAIRPAHETAPSPLPQMRDDPAKWDGEDLAQMLPFSARYKSLSLGKWHLVSKNIKDEWFTASSGQAASSLNTQVTEATDASTRDQLVLLSISSCSGTWDEFDEKFALRNGSKPSESKINMQIYSPYDGFGGHSDVKKGDAIYLEPETRQDVGNPRIRDVWNSPHDYFVLGPYGAEWVGPADEKMYFCASKKELTMAGGGVDNRSKHY